MESSKNQYEDVRIGVFICHCGINIAEKVDVKEVADYASDLPEVVVSKDYKFMCSDPGQEVIEEDIDEHKLNRIVVASCSPRMHEPTFRSVLERKDLNKYAFQMANIREHCSWVTEKRADATTKAKSLVGGAVFRARFHEPLESKFVDIHPDTLIVGGGIAGIQAALDIAESGNKAYIVEKTPSIGGHMAEFDKTFPTLDCSACILTPRMVEVTQNDNIELLTFSEVENVDGYIGNFEVEVKKKKRFVDVDECTGCGECYDVCPASITPEKRQIVMNGKRINKME